MYKYLREEIKELKNYNLNQIECDVKLDANEGIDWLEGLNRYPDDNCTILKEMLSKKLNVNSSNLLFGNGSSELIELVMKTFLENGEKVLSFNPSFAMYRIFTIINKGKYVDYPLNDYQNLDIDGFISFIEEEKPKIVILCNPNNPTGSLISEKNINKIIEACDCIVILDEAYIEFAYENPPLNIHKYDNLIVLRTFSKAYSVAGIRLGYMISNEEIISYVNRVRSPYNISTLAYNYGVKALENEDICKQNTKIIVSERTRIENSLSELGLVPIPSKANFVFFKGPKGLSEHLESKGVLIRAFGETVYRMTLSVPDENNVALSFIEEYVKNLK